MRNCHAILLNIATCAQEYFGKLLSLKGAMCKKVEYLLTEMQYDIHNYVFSGV